LKYDKKKNMIKPNAPIGKQKKIESKKTGEKKTQHQAACFL
jgi:hypothetical protein